MATKRMKRLYKIHLKKKDAHVAGIYLQRLCCTSTAQYIYIYGMGSEMPCINLCMENMYVACMYMYIYDPGLHPGMRYNNGTYYRSRWGMAIQGAVSMHFPMFHGEKHGELD